MHEPLAVGERERAADLEAELEHPAHGQRPRALDELLQVVAVDQLEDDVLAARVLAAIDHGDDVRVRELGDGARLAPKALDVVVVAEVLGVQDLERHVALQEGVERAVDARHASAAEHFAELVPARDQVALCHQKV